MTCEGLEKHLNALQKQCNIYHMVWLRSFRNPKSAFTEDHQQMIVVKILKCTHVWASHATVFGKAHVAYIPNGKIVGLSKIPRVVDAFARRMQVQERLTDQIKNCIQEA
jgi:GTP cyclohydrolase I